MFREDSTQGTDLIKVFVYRGSAAKEEEHVLRHALRHTLRDVRRGPNVGGYGMLGGHGMLTPVVRVANIKHVNSERVKIPLLDVSVVC